MKKYIFILMAGLFLSVLFTACQGDDDAISPQKVQNKAVTGGVGEDEIDPKDSEM